MIEIINNIATFGLIPVVVGFFIYYTIQARKSQDKMQEDMNGIIKRHEEESIKRNKEIMELALKLSGRAGTAQDDTEKPAKNRTKDKGHEDTKINQSITQWLGKLLTDTGASHALYVVFHNGERSSSSRHLHRMSISNESCDRYSTPIMKDLQNFPQSYLPVTIKEITEKGCRYCNDVSGLAKTDTNSFNFCEPRGIKSFGAEAVKNSDQVILGFIVLEFRDEIDFSKNKSIQKMLRSVASKMGAALEVCNSGHGNASQI
jgi:hypothetical protein